MESDFNPFENSYPNRRKIIIDKDKLAEKKINEDKTRKLKKDLSSLKIKIKNWVFLLTFLKAFPEVKTIFIYFSKKLFQKLNLL